jgi:hypothetical protein
MTKYEIASPPPTLRSGLRLTAMTQKVIFFCHCEERQ